jgi:NAD(P)-dependent dehydrogenase (short-subunit alcohol dehydrogenase family)
MFDLHGKVAIVTGGNGGIGLGMAKGWPPPARVVIAARNAQKSSTALRQLAALGPDPFAITVDVTDEQSVDTLIKRRCNGPAGWTSW